MQIHVGAGTDTGRIRTGNEDNFFAEADERRGVFVVADGMGGHAAGEVASEMAVTIVSRNLLGLASVRDTGAAELVGKALQEANRAIFDRMLAESDKQGMGTTASVMVLSDHGYLIGQIGDSRVYLYRDGALIQITKDHSYVQEQVDAGLLTPEQARYHPYSNVITRCVGASDEVEADIYSGDVRVGDVFLLCSDGLTGMVDDRRLAQLLMARSGPGRIVDSLIAEANGRGGLDNITAIVIQVLTLDIGDG
ncbi:MAG TPA: Stp1/IreP family PP2C-type Ser/Thr phosphatase [Gemmatimonadaceae bacterium]|mgnify:CR=1 FL=1|nr:Stp1/IreP family PP2C-type Ser/Thr phosphatase [Gemmatimonadaceae bacterium]HRQ79331.1 Stp1/IreP family PP2C-type Ser/Thr phosphatase [Gemmatimonadaceae bacterium]